MILRILLCDVYLQVIGGGGGGEYQTCIEQKGVVFDILLLFMRREGIPLNGLNSTKP